MANSEQRSAADTGQWDVDIPVTIGSLEGFQEFECNPSDHIDPADLGPGLRLDTMNHAYYNPLIPTEVGEEAFPHIPNGYRVLLTPPAPMSTRVCVSDRKHLGTVEFRVVIINRVDGNLVFSAKLSDFFPPPPSPPISLAGSYDPAKAVDAGSFLSDSVSGVSLGDDFTQENLTHLRRYYSEHPESSDSNSGVFDATSFPYTPAKFDPALFFARMKVEFGLFDHDKYKLWIGTSDLRYVERIDSPERFEPALSSLERVIPRNPARAGFVFFLMELLITHSEDTPWNNQASGLFELPRSSPITSLPVSPKSQQPKPDNLSVTWQVMSDSGRSALSLPPDTASYVSLLSKQSKVSSRIPIRTAIQQSVTRPASRERHQGVLGSFMDTLRRGFYSNGSSLSRIPRFLGIFTGQPGIKTEGTQAKWTRAIFPTHHKLGSESAFPHPAEERVARQERRREIAQRKAARPTPVSVRHNVSKDTLVGARGSRPGATPNTPNFSRHLTPNKATNTSDSALFSFPRPVLRETTELDGLSVLKKLHAIDAQGDLNSTIPLSQSPTDEQWADCCSLLLLSPDNHKDPMARSISIPGTSVKLYPHQYWTVFQILTCRETRDIDGGILADAPGLGKSHIILAAALLKAYIFYHVADIESQWQTHDWELRSNKGVRAGVQKHLPRGQQGYARCSCGNASGVECYSNPEGITRRIVAFMSRGPTVISVPAATVASWHNIVMTAQLGGHYYEPISFLPNPPAEIKPPRDDRDRLAVKLKSLIKVTATARDNTYSEHYVPSHYDATYEVAYSNIRDKQPERFILLTGFATSYFASQFQIRINPLRAGAKRPAGTIYGCPVGLHFVDEFHQVHPLAQTIELAHNHVCLNDRRTDFWAVTGTPMLNKFGDIRSAVDILQREEWLDPAHPHHESTLGALTSAEASYQKSKGPELCLESIEDFRNRAQAFFAGGMVIRRTESSTFFGKPISSHQEVQIIKHTLKTAAKFVPYVQALADVAKKSLAELKVKWTEGLSETAYNKLATLQTLSTFPGAARLVCAGYLDLTTPAINQQIELVLDRKAGEPRQVKEPKGVKDVVLFQQHLEAVLEGSSAFEAILRVLDHMSYDDDVRPKQDAFGKDRHPRDELSRKKLVIFSPRLAEAVFIYLGLLKRHPRWPLALLHGALRPSERTRIIERFNSLAPGTPRVLVASFDTCGTGVNLQTASYHMLTGPLRSRADEQQCFGRTNRAGQQLPVHHHMLLTEDSPAERYILSRRTGRQILTDEFDVCSPLELNLLEGEK